jgi:hypothetical protein
MPPILEFDLPIRSGLGAHSPGTARLRILSVTFYPLSTLLPVDRACVFRCEHLFGNYLRKRT